MVFSGFGFRRKAVGVGFRQRETHMKIFPKRSTFGYM